MALRRALAAAAEAARVHAPRRAASALAAATTKARRASSSAAASAPAAERESPAAEEMEFDVLIVGAGPAGLAAAIRIRQARLVSPSPLQRLPRRPPLALAGLSETRDTC
jgi:hypothetical protein